MSSFAKNTGMVIYKNKAKILNSIAIVGILGVAYTSSKSTLKARELLEELSLEEKDTLRKRVKLVWKEYIPPTLLFIFTSSCIIGAHKIHVNKYNALMALSSFNKQIFDKYVDNVRNKLGKNEEERIHNDVRKEIKDNNPPTKEIIFAGQSTDVLCYDIPSNRYFKSGIERIRRIENDLNKRLRCDMVLTLNELYSELGLQQTKLGDHLGWDIEKDGTIELHYSSDLNEDQTPCLTIDYSIRTID